MLRLEGLAEIVLKSLYELHTGLQHRSKLVSPLNLNEAQADPIFTLFSMQNIFCLLFAFGVVHCAEAK